MAELKENNYYKWYLRTVAAGQLVLPAPTQNDNLEHEVHYGEVFCRMEGCTKGTKQYSSTNNLHSHLQTHEDFVAKAGNKGGRASQKQVDNAVKWYKQLFDDFTAEKQLSTPTPTHTPRSKTATSAGQTLASSPLGKLNIDGPRPPLPLRQDGKAHHITKMRAEIKNMGYPLPCSICPTAKDCCKDKWMCAYFLQFDCSNLAPEASQQKNNAENNEEQNKQSEEEQDEHNEESEEESEKEDEEESEEENEEEESEV